MQKLYKADVRSKYAGCKLHTDAEDCKEILKWHADYKQLNSSLVQKQAVDLCRKLAKSVKAALTEHPSMLEERTPAQIKAALIRDAEKIERQLKAGAAWKEVE